MVWGAVIAAGASLAGAAMSAKGQRDTNDANRDMSYEQMKFQRQMSNTQYQRGVRDMKRAGINPMVAYSQGGASSPGGAALAQQNPNSAYSDAGRSVSSSLQLQRLNADIEAQEAAARKMDADADLARERKTSEIYGQVNTQAATNLSEQQRKNAAATEKILQENYATAKGQATAARNAEAVERSVGKRLRYIDRVVESVSPFK